MGSIQPDFNILEKNKPLTPADNKREVIVRFKKDGQEKAYKITIEGAKDYPELEKLAHEAFSLALAFNVGANNTNKELKISQTFQGVSLDRNRTSKKTQTNAALVTGKDVNDILTKKQVKVENSNTKSQRVIEALLIFESLKKQRAQAAPNPPSPTVPSDLLNVQMSSVPANPSSSASTSKVPASLLAPSSPDYEAAIKKVHSYKSLTVEEKRNIQILTQNNNNAKKINFNKHPDFNVTIRNQGLFDSRAKVIVNAANTHLSTQGNRGINAAILSQGGQSYQNAHAKLAQHYGSYTRGYATMIESGDLKKAKTNRDPIDNVIVIAGPDLRGKGDNPVPDQTDKNALYSCYYNSLVLAHEQGKTSLAFPSISTGIFGFPQDEAAAISTKALYDFMEKYPSSQLRDISVHFYDTDNSVSRELYAAGCASYERSVK